MSIAAAITGFRYETTTVTLIKIATLTINGDFESDIDILTPAIYKSEVELLPTQLNLELTPKTAADLGLSKNASAAFERLITVAETNPAAGDDLTSYYDEGELVGGIESLLPFEQDAAINLLAGETSLAAGPLGQRLDLTRKSDGSSF